MSREAYVGRHAGRASPRAAWSVLAFFLLASVVLALSVGAATVAPQDWLSGEGVRAELVRVWRAPRVAAAFFVGACLSLAGLVFQGVFRNPLAEPYLLGSASGAAVGASVALLLPALVPTAWSLPLLAFAGAWGASWLVLLVGRLGGGWQTGRLLLAGVALAAILAALRSLLLMVYGDESTNLRAVISWQLGGVQTPTADELVGLALLLAALVMLVRSLAFGLDALGMGEEAGMNASARLATLSGGERARVGVARALAHEPALLLADEPAAHLDIPHHHRLMALLSASARERAVVVVLHDLHAAALYCDQLVLMGRGQVMAQGAPEAVLAPDFLAKAYGEPIHIHAVGPLSFFTGRAAQEVCEC